MKRFSILTHEATMSTSRTSATFGLTPRGGDSASWRPKLTGVRHSHALPPPRWPVFLPGFPPKPADLTSRRSLSAMRSTISATVLSTNARGGSSTMSTSLFPAVLEVSGHCFVDGFLDSLAACALIPRPRCKASMHLWIDVPGHRRTPIGLEFGPHPSQGLEACHDVQHLPALFRRPERSVATHDIAGCDTTAAV